MRIVIACAALRFGSPRKPSARPVVVASKPFGESFLLAEMFAQLLEARGLHVDRRPGLGATEIAFRALRTGAIDVYPEYTGTGLLAILGEPPAARCVQRISARLAASFAHAMACAGSRHWDFRTPMRSPCRRATADSLHLDNSQRSGARERIDARGTHAGFHRSARRACRVSSGVTVCTFGDVRALGPAVKYQALAAGQVDVIDGYSTDGLIARYDLVVLDDDRHFFPPYEASALVSQRLAESDAGRADRARRAEWPSRRATHARAEQTASRSTARPLPSLPRDALASLGLGAINSRKR